MKYIYNLSSYIKPGHIISVKKYSAILRREITVFRAYIGDGINHKFLSSLPIFNENITSIELKKAYSRNASIVALDDKDPMKEREIPTLKGKNVFILVHGLDTTELSGTKEIPLYTQYRRKIVFSSIKEHFPDSVILLYIYPSITKRLMDNGKLLIKNVSQLPAIKDSNHVFFIGYSLGGLVVRVALQMSTWLRNITTKVLTINTPHRGTPLLSLLTAKKQLWDFLYSTNHPRSVTLLKEASYIAFQSGTVLAPGHLDLIWENTEGTPGINENTLLTTLNKYNKTRNYILVGSILPNNKTMQTIRLLSHHLRYEPTERFSLLLCDFIIREFGKLLNIPSFNRSDGVAPLSSQIPIKYGERLSPSTPLIFTGDHLDIVVDRQMWHQALSLLS